MESIEPARILLNEFGQCYIDFEREFSQFKWLIEYKAMKRQLTFQICKELSKPYIICLQRYQDCYLHIKHIGPYMSALQHARYKYILKEFNRVYTSITREILIIMKHHESPEKIKELLYAK